jgi:hypothetical protein
MNGLYGQLSPDAGVLTKATTSAPPAGKVRQVVIGVCNTLRDSGVEICIAVSTAISADAVAAVAPYKSFGRKIDAGGEYERPVVLGEGENVYVKSNKAGVAFDIRGFEGAA